MNKKLETKIGILVTCTCALCYLAFSPLLAAIAADFPGVDVSLVQMIMTVPNLMFIVFSPLSGKLIQRLRKKQLAIFSVLLYLAGGIFPFFFHGSVWQILAGSTIMGCGSGLLMPVINAIICDQFDLDERGQLMGLNSTFVAIGGLTFTFISGQLARFGWHVSFLVFLLLIPIIIVMQICLPDSEKSAVIEEHTSSGFEMNPYVAFMFIVGFIYFVMQNAFNTNSAIYVSEIGIGGTETASVVTIGNTLGGMLGGALFGLIAMKMKDQIGTLALTLAGVGFLAAYFFPLLLPIVGGSVLVGAGFAIFNAAGTYILSKYLKPENNAFTVAVYLAVINLGAAISPPVVNFMSGMIGEAVSRRFLLSGAIIAVCAVVSFSVNAAHVKKQTRL